jgi:hypothetical protein
VQDTCEQTLFTEGVYSRRDRAAAKFKRDSEKEKEKEKKKEIGKERESNL